jgi:hypothetical protein
MSEAQLVSKILAALNGLPSSFAFKIVAAPYARKGISDILACISGKFFAFEVKLPGKEKTVTQPQSQFISSVRAAGGHGYIVTSVLQGHLAIAEVFSALSAFESQA